MSGKKGRGKVNQEHQQVYGMARKRDDRCIKSAHRRERSAKMGMRPYLEDDDNYVKFANQLAMMGLCLRDIPGDG